ncbi:hypothetical protein BEP19_01645 [Ammoniphilus oxalaticus]|uniref:Rhodanese domain-containing protein n=1 Tax=Ammoniphilus oxalaticus TaxID=66863 RepID=A0A419SN52_9BACL|nr:rhodanese-like domain-containing protein [Ammoniphilus oxalaticus]RKD25672.1 hypothetical protein BEP19_01645 [Ammoniphilus oxalaticus]
MESHNISASDFVALYKKDGLKQSKIIDVREQHEWDMIHLEQACLIPMNTIPENLEQLSKEQDLYIVCAHGVRSLHVTNYLVHLGYARTINVEGGMAAIAMLLEQNDAESAEEQE